jgi:hypothetical protein
VDIKEKMDLFGQEIELNMVENNRKGGTTSRILLIGRNPYNLFLLNK